MRQNELDAARAGRQNEDYMKFFRYFHTRHCCTALLSMASMLCLSSCEEKEAETTTEAPAEAPAPAPEPAPEPQV